MFRKLRGLLAGELSDLREMARDVLRPGDSRFEPRPARLVDVQPGQMVDVTGTLHPLVDPLRSPLCEVECLWFAARVGRGPREVGEVRGVDAILDDGSARAVLHAPARVEARGRGGPLSRETILRAHAEALLSRHGHAHDRLAAEPGATWWEATLRAGDRVRAVGLAVEAPPLPLGYRDVQPLVMIGRAGFVTVTLLDR